MGNRSGAADVEMGMRRTLGLLVVSVLVVLVVSACGSDDQRLQSGPDTSVPTSTTTEPSGTGPGRVDLPTGADEVVFRVEDCCGFVPVDVGVANVPSLSIMGDGTAIVPGPQIAIYPPPALPNLLAATVDPAQVRELIAKAASAGLLEGGVDFGNPGITDASTTKVTIVFNGHAHELAAYALPMGTGETGTTGEQAGAEPPSSAEGGGSETQPEAGGVTSSLGLTAEQQANRRALRDLIAAADEAVGQGGEPFVPSAVSVFSLAPTDGVEGGIEPGRADWPLDDPNTWPPSNGVVGCKTYTGADAAKVLAAAGSTNTVTQWSAAAADASPVRLIFRPLLPDESTRCTDS